MPFAVKNYSMFMQCNEKRPDDATPVLLGDVDPDDSATLCLTEYAQQLMQWTTAT